MARKRPYIRGLVGKNVFPQFDEAGSDANTLAERWAHKNGVEIGDRDVVPYHDSWYTIEKIDHEDNDNGYSYRVVNRIPKNKYKLYDKIRGSQRGQIRKDGVGRRYYPVDNIDRRRSQYSQGTTDIDDDVFEYAKENHEIYGLAENKNGKRYNQFDSSKGDVSGDENRARNGTSGLNQSRDADYMSAVQSGDMKTAAVGMLRKVKNPIENSRRIWYDRSINHNRQTSRRSSS